MEVDHVLAVIPSGSNFGRLLSGGVRFARLPAAVAGDGFAIARSGILPFVAGRLVTLEQLVELKFNSTSDLSRC